MSGKLTHVDGIPFLTGIRSGANVQGDSRKLARPATIPRARVAETGPKGNSYHLDGFVTLRECRRKGFSEAETRQICLLEPAMFEVYEHAPPNGGPLSVRIRRPGGVDEPAEGRWAS